MPKLILIAVALLALNACSPPNLLHYKYRRHYYEQNYFERDSQWYISQSINFDLPNVEDESYSYDLYLTFLDTAAAQSKRVLNLAVDTAIVQYNYGIFSVWDWDADGSVVTGEIKILHWSAKKIRIKENLVVVDNSRKDIKRFKGRRTIRLKKPERDD